MADRASRWERVSWSRVRVGLLLILAIAIVIYAIWRIGDLFNLFVRRYEIVTLAPSASGLLSGAPVTLAGQRVGLVKTISFLPLGSDGKNNLSIELSVARKVEAYIRTDSYARIRTQGVLGDKYIDITIGSPSLPIVQPGDTIPSVPAVEFEDLLIIATKTLEGVEGLVSDLREITSSLAQGEGTIGELLKDPRLYEEMLSVTTRLGALLNEITGADGTFGRLIRDPALYEELHSAIARVDTLGVAILHGGGTLSRLLESDELYRELLGAITHADSTLAVIGGTIIRLTEGEGTIQRLLTDPALYDQFLKAVIDLQTLIDEIRENPKKFRPEVRVKIF
jgi:phospholipid/cholesterol/gamma-HCH transport system substrate-binding protein